MRLYAVGEAADFEAEFTASNALKTGLTNVTVAFYGPDRALITPDPAVTLHEVVGGVWKATLPAVYVTAAGSYIALFHTATACDLKDKVDIVQVRGIPFATESSLADVLTWNLEGLLSGLRQRLNDVDMGNYLTAELQTCINLAYRETVVAARCHKAAVTLTLEQAEQIYDCDPIFEPIIVTKSGKTLRKTNLKDLSTRVEGWEAATGTLSDWMPESGGSIRVHPLVGATPGTAIVYGYARPDPLEDAENIPVALPEALGVSAILDRAEAEARKMRSTTAYNSTLYDKLMASWKGWVALIAASTKAED